MIGGRRRWVLLAALLLVVAALAVGGLVALGREQRLAAEPERLLVATKQLLGVPLEAREVSATRWPPGVVLHDVRVPDRSVYGPGTLAQADEVRLELSLLALLGGRIVVSDVELINPVVRIVRGVDGGWNLPAAPLTRVTRELSTGHRDAGVGFAVSAVRVVRGELSYRDHAIPGVPELEATRIEVLLHRDGAQTLIEIEARALGGEKDSLRGVLRIPLRGDATLDVRAEDFPANRLPELIQLVRGRLPFGVRLDGRMSVQVASAVPVAWPVERAVLRVTLDGSAASLKAASGLVEKPMGLPAELRLRLQAGSDGLTIDRAALMSGSARLRAVAAGAPQAGSQLPLRLTSRGLDARTLASWIPLLAGLDPQGTLDVRGTLVPEEATVVADLRLSGDHLELRGEESRGRVGAVGLDLSVAAGSELSAGLSLEDLRAGAFGARRISAALTGSIEQGMLLRVAGRQGGRVGAELESVGLECWVREQDVEVRRLDVAGMGGELRAAGEGSVSLAEGHRVLTLRLDPEWQGFNVGSVLRLLGYEIDVQGSLAGRAVLSARAGAGEETLDSLHGAFELRLDRGAIPGLNPARAALDRLGDLPGLRRAIDRQVRATVPALLEPTTEMSELVIGGTIAHRAIDVSRLRLSARDYSLDARGQIALDGALELRGDLELTPAASSSLADASGVLAGLAPAGRPMRIPISVAGRYPSLRVVPAINSVDGFLDRQDAGREPGRLLRRFLSGEGA